MLKLNLGCSTTCEHGYLNVDRWTPPWATPENFQQADLRHSWPWPNGSVDHIRACDILEHLPDPIHTMNEIHRVLKPGGTVIIVVPTTEGAGAFQDPTHKSWWNRNSFMYYTVGDPHYERFHEAYGIKGGFRVVGEDFSQYHDHCTVTKLTMRLAVVKSEKMPRFEPTRIEIPPRDKSNRPEFSIIHTSARPDQWRAVYDAWIKSASNAHDIEYVLVVDERWGFKSCEVHSGDPSGLTTRTLSLRPQDKVIWNTGRRCYVDGVNQGAEASTGEILIVNADDQYPCERWDVEITKAVWGPKNDPIFYGDDFVVEVSTGTPKEHEREILVMPILSRERYERFGWVFYPEYESMYADNDFCAMAKRDDCIVDARHLIFPHKHWINGQREGDAVDLAQSRKEAYTQGEKLFRARKAINFGGVPPDSGMTRNSELESFADQLRSSGRKMVVTCTPGNTFGRAWMDGWTALVIHIVGNYGFSPMSCYASDVGGVRTRMMQELQSAPVPIDYVLWLDDDNVLTPDQFEMLRADLDAHPEFDAVAAWTWCGGDDIVDVGKATMSCGRIKDLELTADGRDVQFCKLDHLTLKEMQASDTDLIEIKYSGFPAVLMRGELIKKAGAFPFRRFQDDRCEVGESGEDVAFFVRTNIRSGARYAVDRRVYVPHYKRRAIEPVPTEEQVARAAREMVAAK